MARALVAANFSPADIATPEGTEFFLEAAE
jgi:hypothetical protein